MLGAGIFLSAASASVGARPADETLGIPAQLPPSAGAGVTIGIDVGSHPTISGDGRYVVYEGVVPVSEEAGAPLRRTVFLADRADGTNVELATPVGAQRTGSTIRPVLSSDGCTVVALSEVPFDVFRDDDEGARWDVYQTALPHCGGILGEWELVSTRIDGTAVARNDVVPETPTVSRGGTVIAYTHRVDHLAEADALTTISVVDLEVPVDSEERTVLAAGLPVSAPDGVYVHAGLDQPALSDDGRHLAFRSDATSADAVPQWAQGPVQGGPATRQVFVWDRAEPDPFLAVTLVSARPDGSPAERGAEQPTISRDASVVAFVSADAGLVDADYPPCDDTCPTQVFRLDRDADDDGVLDGPDDGGGRELRLVSRDRRADRLVAGAGASTAPRLTTDGEQLVFASTAANLTLIATEAAADGDGAIFAADFRLGTLARVSEPVEPDRRGVGSYARPAIDDLGRTIVFDKPASPDVVPGELAEARQVVALNRPPTLSLADTDLGTTRVGLKSDEWYVAVVNDGPSGFTPASVTLDDPHFGIDEERSTCTLGTVIHPGSDCTIRISFTPTAQEEFSGLLTVAEEGFEAVSVSAFVSGSGGEPALRADPAGADLGRVVVGSSSAEFHYDVGNVSAFATTIASVIVSGEHGSDFSVTTDNCAGRPLNPAVTCNIGVTFSPTDAGRRTGLVEIFTPEGQYTSVLVAGDGAFEPRVEFLDTTVVVGEELLAFGQGYPPNSDVVVVFGDAGEFVVSTNGSGEFIQTVPVPAAAGGGSRTVVVESGDGVAAAAPVELIEEPELMIGMPGFGLGG